MDGLRSNKRLENVLKFLALRRRRFFAHRSIVPHPCGKSSRILSLNLVQTHFAFSSETWLTQMHVVHLFRRATTTFNTTISSCALPTASVTLFPRLVVLYHSLVEDLRGRHLQNGKAYCIFYMSYHSAGQRLSLCGNSYPHQLIQSFPHADCHDFAPSRRRMKRLNSTRTRTEL
jgi:hypothetical protein